MSRRPHATDRGAVAVIVALTVTFALLGLSALAINTGTWYSERSQLQNGADASALAVAESCASSGGCDTTLATGSGSNAGEADNNANDKLAKVDSICGVFTSGGSYTCLLNNSSYALPPANDQYCPKAPGAGSWVNVHTSTLLSGGLTTIPIIGSLTANSPNIKTCAQANWGPYGGGSALAITMSLCAWEQDTNSTPGGTPTYATPEPPYDGTNWPAPYTAKVDNKNPVVPNVGGENVFQISGQAKQCSGSSAGLNVPGGFAWITDQSNGQPDPKCVANTSVGGYVYSNPGGLGGKNSDCSNALQSIWNAGIPIPNSQNPVYVPVFDMACDSSGKLTPPPSSGSIYCPAGMPDSSYHIAGYATFVLTGYDVSPISADSMITNKPGPCNGSFDCLYGMFTTGLVKSTGQIGNGGGSDFGAPTIVKLSG